MNNHHHHNHNTTTMTSSTGKEKLVVEVVAAHNLMPKDGEGSSSPFVEVEFENQRLRTQVKYKDLNPIWNENLVFHVSNAADLPYRTIDLAIFNERRSGNSRNFLGKVRLPGSAVAADEAHKLPQLFTLDKRSLFSHVRGEITLNLYLSTREEVIAAAREQPGGGNNHIVVASSKKAKKLVQTSAQSGNNNNSNNNSGVLAQRQAQLQSRVLQESNGGNVMNSNKGNNVIVNLSKPVEPSGLVGVDLMKPVVITAANAPASHVPVGVGPGAYGGSAEFSLKETRPRLGGEAQQKDKTSSTYDLVEQVQYLYVRVVRARDVSAFGDLVAEVKLGNYRGVTKRVGSGSGSEWDQVFAFSKDCIQSSVAEVLVRESNKEDFLGRVWFDLNEVPRRVPPDSQLAPQWYRMEDRKGERSKPGGEVMVSVWFGTQADEAFAEAWHSKAASVNFDGLCSIKSKVYLSPKLWYLRVSVVEGQDIVAADKAGVMMMRFPEISVKAQVGNQVLRTRIAQPSSNRSLSNPYWNEEMMFVVAEPFEDYLIVNVEDRSPPGRDEVVGRVVMPLTLVEKRINEKVVVSRWFNLDNGNGAGHFGDGKTGRFGARIHLRVSLEGGYHVLDEATIYSSDVRPTEKHLWKPHIGVLEMGILGATGLMPVKIKEGKGGGTDAYCVAKYGQKWVRTRTVVDSLSPKWNEQYTWEVFDPCTVITIGVFDNSRVDKNMGGNNNAGRDSRIGKVRIRLSTLETDRVYTHSYPLLMLHTSGVKKMGELHLAVRFSCTNMTNMLNMYTMPLLPKMHYVNPLSVNQLETLRHQAMNVVASRLSRAEPPLGREVVEYMLDHDSNVWSMRRSKANFFRLVNVLSGIVAMGRWVEAMRNWHKPVYSTLFLVSFLLLVLFPELIIPMVLLYMAFLGLWRYRSRPRHPPHMDTHLSNADNVYPDEVDEEFDTFPTSRSADVVRMRYDRLRSVAGRIQTVVGDMASQGERFQALISWRDPRASFLFVIFCLVAAVGFYAVPIRVVVALWGLYALRPPKFRSKLPPQALNFFRRLPTRADSML